MQIQRIVKKSALLLKVDNYIDYIKNRQIGTKKASSTGIKEGTLSTKKEKILGRASRYCSLYHWTKRPWYYF